MTASLILLSGSCVVSADEAPAATAGKPVAAPEVSAAVVETTPVQATSKSVKTTQKISDGPVVLQLREGNMELAYISLRELNRIVTPFKSPKWITISDADVKVDGNTLYITAKNGAPIQLYLTDNNGKAPTYGVTFVPSDYPIGQEIVLKAEQGTLASPTANAVDESAPAASDYVDGIRELTRSVIRDDQCQLTRPAAQCKDLRVKGFTRRGAEEMPFFVGKVFALQRGVYTGPKYQVNIYRMENKGKDAVELSEQNFYNDKTRAVAIFPTLTLKPGDVTNLYVVLARK